MTLIHLVAAEQSTAVLASFLADLIPSVGSVVQLNAGDTDPCKECACLDWELSR